jgi:hypothetical protein
MTNTPIQITTDLATILERIEAKFDRFEQKLDKLDEKFEQKLDKLDEKFERKFEEIEQKLDKLDEKFEQKIDKLDEKFEQKSQATALSLARLEESQKGLSTQITELSSKVNNLEGRVNVQVNWFLGIITVLVGALVTALSKFVFFPTNNP